MMSWLRHAHKLNVSCDLAPLKPRTNRQSLCFSSALLKRVSHRHLRLCREKKRVSNPSGGNLEKHK